MDTCASLNHFSDRIRIDEQIQSNMQLEKSIYAFIKTLERFDYQLPSMDPTWEILFPDSSSKWQFLHVSKYRETFYMVDIIGEKGSLEVEPGKSVKIKDGSGFSEARLFYPDEDLKEEWEKLIAFAGNWLTFVERDWIKANKQIQLEFPLKFRIGTAPGSLIRASLPDIYQADKELGKQKTKKFIKLVEEGYFRGMAAGRVESFTASKFFNYCKIAYLAGAKKGEKIDSSLSGMEMYKRFADGRHEGLLDIDPDSEQDFANWMDYNHPKRERGGHPWEIKRGGNTTHISMYVRRPTYNQKNGFIIELDGQSFVRLVETIKMFLALHEASLPISISKPESIRKRLLGQDNIGIIPAYSSLHRANQQFAEDEEVFDVMYYDGLGRYKRRITPFIRWEALPILKMKAY